MFLGFSFWANPKVLKVQFHQAYIISEECIYIPMKIGLLEKIPLHMSHICNIFAYNELNWYGSLNVLLVNKTFYMGHIYDFFTIMNGINVGPFGNASPHESHLWSFWLLCTELMGIFKYPAWEKFPGEQHCKNPMAL